MELTKEIKEILENVVYWDTCPKDYKDKINKYLKSVNESEALSIHNVSQQREPLLAYHKYLDSLNDPTVYNASESMIDDYLANNCG